MRIIWSVKEMYEINNNWTLAHLPKRIPTPIFQNFSRLIIHRILQNDIEDTSYI